jgi:hypothetical protein
MDAQGPNQSNADADQGSSAEPKPKSGNGERDKFPEPRAWALRWQTETQFSAGSRLEDRSPDKGNGEGEKFPQPRGWALQWDGFSIGAIQDFYNHQTPPPTPDSGKDVA